MGWAVPHSLAFLGPLSQTTSSRACTHAFAFCIKWGGSATVDLCSDQSPALCGVAGLPDMNCPSLTNDHTGSGLRHKDTNPSASKLTEVCHQVSKFSAFKGSRD